MPPEFGHRELDQCRVANRRVVKLMDLEPTVRSAVLALVAADRSAKEDAARRDAERDPSAQRPPDPSKNERGAGRRRLRHGSGQEARQMLPKPNP